MAVDLLQRLVDWWPSSPVDRVHQRYYEAAVPTDYHPTRGSPASGDELMQRAGRKLKDISRYLEENHDLTVGIFEELDNNIVGSGVAIEPMVRTRAGDLDKDVNKALIEAFEEWGDYPEVTEAFGWNTVERMVSRHLFRDGEIFYQGINSSRFNYRTRIPFVLELIDSDMVPFDYTVEDPRITHGIERNGWGAPVAYHVLDVDPGENPAFQATTYGFVGQTRRVSARRMRHIKFARRLNQARGVPIVHSVIPRIRDLKDYEESERIAARVASNFAVMIERDISLRAQFGTNDYGRKMNMAYGGIMDLLPGEKVSTVDSNRPNEGLVDFRRAMVNAIAAGTSTKSSAISRDYSQGNYSSQRQELVETVVGYRALFSYLRARFYRPVWREFVTTAVLSGRVSVGRSVDMETLLRADFRPPALPWIDPLKEANAWKTLVETKLESHMEIQRNRGRDPRKVAEEIRIEQESGLYDSINPQPADETTSDDEPVEDNDDEQRAASA